MSARFAKKLLHIHSSQKKVLAILVDPEKWNDAYLNRLFSEQFSPQFDWVFVGGSTVDKGQLSVCLKAIKERTNKPVIIFPGDPDQVDPRADALLLLSLLNSRNPEFIVGKHIESAEALRDSGLELISTAYILVGHDHETEVARVSNTIPLSDPDQICRSVLAAEQMGKQLVYLESGSGADRSLDPDILRRCREEVDIPIVVGGGIQTLSIAKQYWQFGADIVVVGTAIEHDMDRFFRS